jgi:uncharacterized coiled-coil protein SlyX
MPQTAGAGPDAAPAVPFYYEVRLIETEVRIAELRRKIAMQQKIIKSLDDQGIDTKIAQKLLDRLEKALADLSEISL